MIKKKSWVYVFMFCLLISLVSAGTFEKVDEYHSLTEHYIVLKLSNTEKSEETYSFDFKVIDELKNSLDIKNAKIELQRNRSVLIPDYTMTSSIVECKDSKELTNGTEPICFTKEHVLSGYIEEFQTYWLDVGAIVTKSIESTDLITKISNEFVLYPETDYLFKVSWQTPLSPGEWGTEGDWSINPSGWWNTTFDYCRNVTITNVENQSLIDFPALIVITNITDMQADLGDVRFVNESCNNGGSELYYEVENVTTQGYTWVKLYLPASTTRTISMYYGDASIANGESPTDVWDSNHKAVWHLSNGNTDDSTNNNVDEINRSGTINFTSEHCAVAGCIGLGNDESYVQFDSNPEFDFGTGSFTVEVYHWTDDWDNPQIMVSNADYVASWSGFDFQKYVSFQGYTGALGHYPTADNYGAENTGLYLAYVRDGSAQTLRYIKSGSQFGAQSTSVSTNVDVNTNFFFGRNADDVYPRYGWGFLDEVRVSDTVRSIEWLNQTYQMITDQASTVSISSPESAPAGETGVIDLLFINSTGGDENAFDSGEDFIGRINLTLSTTGEPINNSNCTLSFPNGLLETKAPDTNFTLCQSGCNYSTYSFEVSNSVTNAVMDSLRMELCHPQSTPTSGLYINGTCGAIKVNGSVPNTEIPSCTDGYIIFVLNDSRCKTEPNIQIDLTLDVSQGQRIEVVNLEHDREYSTYIMNTTFNVSAGLYYGRDIEYYETGLVDVLGQCVNFAESVNATTHENITISNIPPVAYHNDILIDGIYYDFVDGVVLNVSDISHITFFIAVFDDNFLNTTDSINLSNGSALWTGDQSQAVYSWSFNGSNFIEYNYSFNTIARDENSSTFNISTDFEVWKYTPQPNITLVNFTDRPYVQGNNSMNCSAIVTDSINTSIYLEFRFYENAIAKTEYWNNVTATNNTLVYSSKLVNETLNENEVWECEVIAYNGVVYSSALNDTVIIGDGIVIEQKLIEIDLSTTPGVLLFGFLIFFWIALVVISRLVPSMMMIVFTSIVGLFFGFLFQQIHPAIMYFMIALNLLNLFEYFID